MKIIFAIIFIFIALGLIKPIILTFIAIFLLFREKEIGKATIYMLFFVAEISFAFLLINTSFSFFWSDSHSYDKEIITHFIEAIDAANRATSAINRGKPYSIMNEQDTEDMMNSYRSALVHAEQVDTAFLNQKLPGWGDHFEKEFLSGLRLMIEGNKKADIVTTLTGQKLLDSWGNWYNSHIDEIKKLR